MNASAASAAGCRIVFMADEQSVAAEVIPFMVKPVAVAFGDDPRVSAPIRRLIPILLHLSTAAWLAGGFALIAAALWFDASARLATALCVGALYLYRAVGNLAGVRGFHPGWVLCAIAVGLIGYGVA